MVVKFSFTLNLRSVLFIPMITFLTYYIVFNLISDLDILSQNVSILKSKLIITNIYLH